MGLASPHQIPRQLIQLLGFMCCYIALSHSTGNGKQSNSPHLDYASCITVFTCCLISERFEVAFSLPINVFRKSQTLPNHFILAIFLDPLIQVIETNAQTSLQIETKLIKSTVLLVNYHSFEVHLLCNFLFLKDNIDKSKHLQFLLSIAPLWQRGSLACQHILRGHQS